MKSRYFQQVPQHHQSINSEVKIYRFKGHYKLLFLFLFATITTRSFAGTYTAIASGNWSSAATWQSGLMPLLSTDDVIVGNGVTLTVDASKTCNSISFTAPGSGTGLGTLTISSGVILTVSGAVSAPALTAAIKTSGTYNVTGSGQISCGLLNIGNSLTPTGSALSIVALISTINNLSITGNVNIYSAYSSGSSGKINNGKLSIQAGTVTVKGTINTTNANANNASGVDLVTSANNPSLVLNGATPFALSGTGTNNINFNGPGATVTYNYTGSQAIFNTAYTNLILAGSGTKTAGGALTVAGNITIASGSTFAAGSFTHSVSGDWSNSGTFTAGTSTINLNGFTQQNISGTSATIFNNLSINNTAGASVTTSPTINGTLTFVAGRITTGTNKVKLGSTATTSGAGDGKYIYGNEEIFIPNSAAPSRTFDIGDNSNYTPVNVAFVGTTTGSGSITASTIPVDHSDINNSGINSALSVNRYWTLINSSVGGFTSYAATFNFVTADSDPSTNPSDFVVRLLNGTTWNTTNLVNAGTFSTKANGMTTFGSYQIGTLATLPSIVTNPADVASCSTTGAILTAAATASPAPSIQWQRDPNTGTFADINSATDGGIYTNYNSSTLNISSTAGLANYKYRAVFTNVKGSVSSASATLSVTTAPSATFSYGATSFCNTGSVSVDLTGGTAGGSFSSATGLIINSASGLIDLGNSTAGDYVVSYSFPANGVCSAVQNNVNITITAIGTWTGALSTSWNVAANWQCNTVPTSSTNVTIPSGLFNYPLISSGVTGLAKNLTLETGASITVVNGTLKVAGTTTTSGGKIAASSGKVEFNGSTAQVIPANLFNSNIIKDLVITNTAGVSLAGAVRVTNTVGFGNVNNSVLDSKGFLTLVSTAANTANVTDITNGGLNSGNKIIGDVTVERYMLSRRAFRFFTAPVNSTTSIRANWMENANNSSTSVNNNPAPGYGTHITGTGGSVNGFDATNTNNSSLYTFNNATQTWIAASNTAGLFTAGSGLRLLIRGSRSVDLNNNAATPSATTLRATGTLVTGPVVFAATGGTAGMPTLSNVIGAYSFIANPYASVVDWNAILASATDISETMYIFDPTITGSNGRGGYVSYNAILKVKNIVSSLVSKDVQSGQAFFVQTTGRNPSLTFNESYKTTSFLPIFRTGEDFPHLNIALQLPEQVGTTDVADGTAVYFSNDYSSSLGNDDSYKFTNQDENLAILRDGKTLSLEGRKLVQGADSIPLKIWQLTKNNYSLKINMENFTGNIEGYLQDKFLNVFTPLVSGENNIPFSITSDVASSATDRFKIVFETFATLPVRITGLKAYPKNKNVQIDWVAESESNIDIYEVERSADAQHYVVIGSSKAINNPGISAPYSCSDINPFDGDNYYRIKTVEKSGETKLSEVVKVQLANAKNTISVTDNPVFGNTIKLLFDNVAKGTYITNLISASGERVYSGKISYDGGISRQQIELTNHLPVGVYQLQVSNGTFSKTIQVVMR